jgi:class 3 adenylate cyclase
MGTMDEGNFIREFPRLGSLWNTRRGKRLHQTLNLTALTRTEQYIEEDGQAYFGFPCLSARGFIIGGSFPIQKFIDTAARQKELLGAICLFLLFLLLFLGTLTAKHLLVPLSLVEQGLRRVADGDLNVRLALKRDDELGDLTGTFDRMIEGIRQRRDLGRFVPADFDARVSAQEGQSSTAAPEKRNGCVLISDIRQFTTLTESYPPRDIVAMLNVHHQTMSSLVEKHGGFVRQFIGDAIIATFFDESARDSCRRAVVAAHDMMREHHAIVDRRRETGQFVYEIGVGIDWGELITGTIGSSGQLGHALLGSPRGTSEKLEGASKQGSHTRIMVSPAVKDACSHHVWAATPVADCWELEREATPL